MTKKGFTLVELLGVVVILAIVLGLAVLAFINNQGGVNKTYYKTLEESLLIPGGDYFNYNKGEQPGAYGDEKRVSAQILKNGGYLEEDIIGADKEPCDLQNSYVGAYKDSKDKTNYYACLVCGEYKTDSTSCNGEIDYTLGVRANKKESKDVYKTDGKSWSNEDIVLTFETLNDMEEVELENESGEKVGSCKLEEVKGIKSCTIEVLESGNYKAYAKNGKSETKKKDLNILIDKTGPEFEFQDKGVDGRIEVLVENVNVEKAVKNKVYDIKDSESGIKSVEYSFESENSKDNYHGKGVVESFDIEKNLKTGTYYLRVRVTNNAGITNEKVLEYIVYKKIVDPTKESHCNDLTYSGKVQTLVKNPGEGYTFENTTGTYAGDYNIGILLKEGYRYSDGSNTKKNLVCTIKTKDLIAKANNQTITYGDTFNTTNINGVTVTGLVSGDSKSSINLSYDSEVNELKTRTIHPSNLKVKRGTVDVTNNYNIEYQTGELTINPKLTLSKSGGTKYTNNGTCYTGTITIKATCTSIDEINSFSLGNASYSDDKKSVSGSVEAYSANMTCITIYGTSASGSKSYKKCTYSRHKSCGVASTTWSGTCKCITKIGGVNIGGGFSKSCTNSNHNCKSLCGASSGGTWSGGSCSSSTTYKKCYHA